MSNEIVDVIDKTKDKFVDIAGKSMSFESERGYAIELLESNTKLLESAKANPKSLMHALRNVAAIGLSLNPAKRQAYLITRNVSKKDQNNKTFYQSQVCLEPSYMGLCDLATQSGMIEWIQAKVVYENDTYENIGLGEKPIHKYNAFQKRGEMVGVYCVAKTNSGDYLSNEMDKEKINSIMERSESVKAARKKNTAIFGPWGTDYEEMARKTVIKQAYKTLPKSPAMSKLDQAVFISNENEGFEPIQTEPESGFSLKRKEYFDELIEKSDGIGMYCLQQDITENEFTSLYHSFLKGSKGKYQQLVRVLIAKGKDQIDDYEISLLEAIETNDDIAVSESIEGLTQDQVNILLSRLSNENLRAYKEITGA